MINRVILLSLFNLLVISDSFAQTIFPIYPDSIPNSTGYPMKEGIYSWDNHFGGYKNVSVPTLEIFKPTKVQSTGTSVIICPGGGYLRETYAEEGIRTAKAFADHGITAFVLKYRLPSDSIMKDKSIGPMQDAQQAIKTVRQRSTDWNIDKDKIGIMGFSAGGHLASTAGTHFDTCFVPNAEHISVRPDFMILVYPVISMTEILTHRSSRRNLLGLDPAIEKVKFFSNELQVTDKTPPTYLTHTADDKTVDVSNSILFYLALIKHHVPAEMHLYPKGDHGFVLDQPTEDWMQPLFVWLKSLNTSN